MWKQPDKVAFKLFDFFGNCDFFETEFNYDQVIELPKPRNGLRLMMKVMELLLQPYLATSTWVRTFSRKSER